MSSSEPETEFGLNNHQVSLNKVFGNLALVQIEQTHLHLGSSKPKMDFVLNNCKPFLNKVLETSLQFKLSADIPTSWLGWAEPRFSL